MSGIHFKNILTKSAIVFLLFMVGVGIFIPPSVYAKTVNLESHLSPEQIKRAQDSANKMSADAIKSIESQKGYNVGEIVIVVLLNLLFMAIMYFITKRLVKHRIGRILYIPIILISVLLFCVLLFLFIFAYTPKFHFSPPPIPVHYSTP